MRRAATIGAGVVALVLASAGAALACPTCISSAYGDRTFNWAYLWLFTLPFAISATIGGILAWRAGIRPRLPRIAPRAHGTKETT
jgi:hypothetical protein